MYFKLLLTVVLLVSVCQCSKYQRTVRYNDEVIIRCPLEVAGMKEFLASDDVDIWKITQSTADVRINKRLLLHTEPETPVTKCTTVVPNVESLVQEFENITLNNRKVKKLQWFEEYHTYDEIYTWYQDLAENCFETSAAVCRFNASIGKSLEGRDQPAIHITKEPTGDPKRKIYFQCQNHAREWISGATCMYIAEYLVKNADTDERVINLLQMAEFIFVPFVNPDGYEYTWNGDRLWRKNRRENSGSTCRGVDLNRNYNDHWNEGGSSSNPCSETYHGMGPASEPETQNTQKYFKANSLIVGGVDWHSYSQLLLRPYGWTSQDSPDEAVLKELGDDMSRAIFDVNGMTYTPQKAIGLYPTSGTARDWFYGEDANENSEYRAAGLTIELRDTGFYGFLLPPDQIIPTGEENMAGALEFASRLVTNPLPKQRSSK